MDSIPLHGATILSTSGELEASPEQRKYLCLLSDNRLFVARSHVNAPHVLSYQTALTHLKRRYIVHQCDIEQVAQLYALASSIADTTDYEAKALKLFAEAADIRAAEMRIRVNRDNTDIWMRVKRDMVFKYDETSDTGLRLCTAIYGSLCDPESIAGNPYQQSERQSASISVAERLGSDLLDSIRIETAPTRTGNVMTVRFLYKTTNNHDSLSSHGWDDDQVAMVDYLALLPSGMNFMSGPTGSGKSTALAIICRSIVAKSGNTLNLVTVEDPAEYPIENAVQTVIKRSQDEDIRKRDYNRAIAGSLRLDPDLLMIGEIRDESAARSAFTAAITGHPVWTSIHTNSAYDILIRLIDLGINPSFVMDHNMVTGLMAQRLPKRLCDHCKIPLLGNENKIDEQALFRIKKALHEDLSSVFIKGDGCMKCGHDGKKGNGIADATAIVEVIVPDDKFMALAKQGDRAQALEYWKKHLGGKSLLDHALIKIKRGEIDPVLVEKDVGPLYKMLPLAHGVQNGD